MKIIFIAMMIVIGVSVSAHATLIDRGGGLIYDSDLNITWLQDANYAHTTGYTGDGVNINEQFPEDSQSMYGPAAITWAEDLSYYDSIRGITYTDWRLPKAYLPSSTSICYGGNCIDSEIGHLWYTELQNDYVDVGSLEGAQKNRNAGPFQNVRTWYWTQTPDQDLMTYTYGFHWSTGDQNSYMKEYTYNSAWAVRDGDVAGQPIATPEPSTMLLFGAGLAGFGLLGKRFKL